MIRFFWLFLLLPLSAASPHKYYISTTDIYYQAAAQELQLVVRVFTDDLQLALSKHTERQVSLDPNNIDDNALEAIIAAYFQDNFVFHHVSDKTTFSLVGWEYKEDKTFLYVAYEQIGTPQMLSWSNSFLMDVFANQKNIVTLYADKIKKSFLHTQDQILAQYSL